MRTGRAAPPLQVVSVDSSRSCSPPMQCVFRKFQPHARALAATRFRESPAAIGFSRSWGTGRRRASP